MEENLQRLLMAKINFVWADMNIDIDPFIVFLDKDGKVIIARLGSNMAEYKGGSLKISYERARQALEGKKVSGGTKVYWLGGESPKYKREFLGAIGISGLGEEREYTFTKKLAQFRSHNHIQVREFSLLFDLDLKTLIQAQIES